MLFDLNNDPNETTDIASKNSALIKQIEGMVKKEHRHPHIKEWEFIDPKFN